MRVFLGVLLRSFVFLRQSLAFHRAAAKNAKNCCDVATLVVIAKAQGLCQMIILLPFQKLENIAS